MFDYQNWMPPTPPETYRQSITSRPEDTETHYHCNVCGLDEYRMERDTAKYPADKLPLSHCPRCGTYFTHYEY